MNVYCPVLTVEVILIISDAGHSGNGHLQCQVTHRQTNQGPQRTWSVLKANQGHQSMRREFSNNNIKKFPNQRYIHQQKTIALLYCLLLTYGFIFFFCLIIWKVLGWKEGYRYRHYILFAMLKVLLVFWPWLSDCRKIESYSE